MIANVLKGHDMKEEKKKTLHVCVSKCYLNFSLFSMHLLPSVWHVSVNFSRPSFLIVSSNFKMSFQFLINILVLWQCVVLGEINSKAAYFIFDQEKSFELRKLCILVFYLSNFPFFLYFWKGMNQLLLALINPSILHFPYDTHLNNFLCLYLLACTANAPVISPEHFVYKTKFIEHKCLKEFYY